MFPIKKIEDLKDLNELESLQNPVKVVREQDKLGKPNFHEDMKKVFEPVTKSLGNTFQDLTKTLTETSSNNNKAIENLNNNFREKMNDRGIIASYLLSALSEITNPENTSQYKIMKDSSSTRVNFLKIHNSVPITLHKNLLTFRDENKQFELKGDLLEMITNKNYNVHLSKLSNKKIRV